MAIIDFNSSAFNEVVNNEEAVGCSPLFFKERGPTAKQAGGES
jgi:hypothetical protein